MQAGTVSRPAVRPRSVAQLFSPNTRCHHDRPFLAANPGALYICLLEVRERRAFEKA